MKMIIKKAGIFLLLTFLITSCVSRKKMIYLQNIDNRNSNSSLNFEPKLQPDDLLSIVVSTENPELSVPFNMPEVQTNYDLNKNQTNIKNYLIDNSGYIDYPIIGKIKLSGLTKTEANKLLVKNVSEYVKNPSINLSILNYKISVLGEVTKPNSYTIVSERITILEALSLAGDLTIYGKRDNVLLIREVDGKKSYNRIDLTRSDFINSPFYYLTQNDVIYVEPNNTKINSSVFGPNVTTTIYAFSLAATVLIIFLKK